jgi:signal transduction histidine kinase
MKVGLNYSARGTGDSSATFGESIEQAMRDALDRAIASVRRLAAGLRRAILDDLGLLPALEWLVADLQQRSPLRIVLNDETGDTVFSETASTALFRIVQESLTNVVRHARSATEVRIDFRCNASMCDLLIQDDGVSIEPLVRRSADMPASSGLASIRDRVRRLRGTVSTGPLPGRGFWGQALDSPRRNRGSAFCLALPPSMPLDARGKPAHSRCRGSSSTCAAEH